MTNNDISQRILDTIASKQLQPRQQRRAQLRRFGVWLGVVACVGLTSLAIGTTFSIAQGNEWGAYHQTGALSKPVFIFLLCYFWLLVIAACAGATYMLFTRTRHGYRYRFATITGIAGVFGVCLGMMVFFSGAGHEIDEQCQRIIPGYGQVLSQSNQLWVQPHEGRLYGRVRQIKAPQTFTVVDPHGRVWLIQTDAELRDTVTQLQEEKTVRMTGSQVDDSTFFAKHILLYQLPHSFFAVFGANR